jgi:diguanylate cyclase (GGDEF)-like protein
MASIFKLNGVKLATSLIAICAALSAGVYFINKQSVDRLLKNNAIATSTSAAHYFEKYIPDLEDILKGTPPTAAAKDFVDSALVDKGVERFKLYDLSGTLIIDSELMEHPIADPDGETLGAHNADAADVLANGAPVASLEVEHTSEGDELIAETYVPIIRDGKKVGVAEVYADQTGTAAVFRNTFAFSSLLIAALAALGFSVPAFGFHLRNKQKLAADENLHFLANHDALTSLPNRNNFQAELAKGLNTALDNGQVSTLHFIDLDFFKEINDRHGHDFGDEVLRAVAGRLKQTLREGDVVARLGGDEFVIAQFGFTKNEQIHAATGRITRVFKEPIKIRNSDVTLTASIGTAVSPQHGQNVEQLIKSADTAVYVVKARGRNAHCYFEARFDEEKAKRIELEAIVRDAVAKKSFELNFQPLFVFNDSSLKGFEALLRMKDRSGKPVSPAEFIPVAEEIGLIDEIGTWVLENACMTAASWPNALQISVNLSVAQFKRRSVVASTRLALANSGIAPQRLLLEITESLLMSDTDTILEQLQELKTLGVAIVMDDFGTGYSSLGYMLKFPFDRIKIDRSFVKELDNGNENTSTVIKTIVALGHTLNMNVTAEGVETVGQADALRNMKCDDAQGYLYGRPMPASEIPALLLKTFSSERLVNAGAPPQHQAVA